MQELIADATLYNMGANRTPRIIIRTDINGSNPAYSGSGASDVDIYPIPTPPSVCTVIVVLGI